MIAKSSVTKFITRTVHESTDTNTVRYRQVEGGKVFSTSLCLWRKWAADAVVIVQAS